MCSQKDCAMNLVSQSETQRKEYSQLLQNEKVKNERQSNYITDLKQKIQIKLMETDIMGDQLKSLFDAIESLSDKKKMNDQEDFEAEVLTRKIKQLVKGTNKAESDYQVVSIKIIDEILDT